VLDCETGVCGADCVSELALSMNIVKGLLTYLDMLSCHGGVLHY